VGCAANHERYSKRLREFTPEDSAFGLIIFVERARWIHAEGNMLPLALPVLFVAFWIAVLIGLFFLDPLPRFI